MYLKQHRLVFINAVICAIMGMPFGILARDTTSILVPTQSVEQAFQV
jgi:ABC-type proline/glycine betaine transport system permease subunit